MTTHTVVSRRGRLGALTQAKKSPAKAGLAYPRLATLHHAAHAAHVGHCWCWRVVLRRFGNHHLSGDHQARH